MGLPMTIQADHLVTRELIASSVVRLHRLKLRRMLMTVQAVLIVEAHARTDRLFVGVRRVARQVAITGQLRFHIPGEAVVTVAVVALIFRDPLILIMSRGQGAAIGVTQIVDHWQHNMAARAPADFMHSFESVIVGDEDCARGHHDERCEGR